MDFFARTHIAFAAELSVSDQFLKTVHGGHASERVHRRCELFLASHFSILWERKFLEKGSLTKTCHEFVTRSTKELMVLTSLSSSCFASFSSLVVAASALLA
jgi:hypothetical protein